jgi:hypothetical protein
LHSVLTPFRTLGSGTKLTTYGDAGNVSASAYSRVRKVCGRVTAKAEICRVHHIAGKALLYLKSFILVRQIAPLYGASSTAAMATGNQSALS